MLTPAYLRTQDLKSLVTIVKAVGIVDERGEAEEEKVNIFPLIALEVSTSLGALFHACRLFDYNMLSFNCQELEH